MSYPDLGCFAECLECELCPKERPPEPPDLGLPDDYHDPSWGDDPFDGWDEPPEDDGGGAFDDFEVPGLDLPGGGRATPTWNDGPGFQLEWPWG